MEIISVKLKGKNANIFTISTNTGEYLLHSDIIVKHAISVGAVPDNKFEQALQESEILIAFNKVLTYINTKIKTEKQIKDYLYKKGYHANVVNPVIEKLKSYNLINDKNYIQSYINSNPNYSKRKMQQKLQQAGVKQSEMEEDLNKIDDLPSCNKAVQKYFKTKVADKTNVEKLTRRLIGQGYSWDTIKQAISQYINLDDYN